MGRWGERNSRVRACLHLRDRRGSTYVSSFRRKAVVAAAAARTRRVLEASFDRYSCARERTSRFLKFPFLQVIHVKKLALLRE